MSTSRIFIPGYEVTFTVDAQQIDLSADTVALAFGANTLAKPRFGVPAGGAIGGQSSGTFNCSGHGTVEDIPKIQALRANAGGVAVPVVVNYGDAAGASDGGNDSFDCVIGEVTWDAAADGQLSWAISGMVDGDVTYVAATP